MRKEKSQTIVVGITGAIIAVVLICASILLFLNVIFGGDTVETTSLLDYGQFEDLSNYSGLDIFPQSITAADVEDYYYYYQDTLFDPTCQIYLSCTYDNEDYEAEVQRLSQISRSYDGTVQQILYDTSNYTYPAYVTINADNHCYEYALLAGDNKVIYVFLAFINETEIVFDSQYLPNNYEDESTSDSFSVYKYYFSNGDAYFLD